HLALKGDLHQGITTSLHPKARRKLAVENLDRQLVGHTERLCLDDAVGGRQGKFTPSLGIRV
nr:hypothetical protein [Actinomycetota bacterium]